MGSSPAMSASTSRRESPALGSERLRRRCLEGRRLRPSGPPVLARRAVSLAESLSLIHISEPTRLALI
eukprot:8595671-Alexandrium_andersonii.AAC.1